MKKQNVLCLWTQLHCDIMPYASKRPLPQICLKITRDIEKAFIFVQRDGEKNSKYYNYFNMLGRADQETLKYAPIGKNRVEANDDLLPLKFVYPLYTYLELIKEENLIDHELYEKDLKQVVSGSNVHIPDKNIYMQNPEQERRKQALYDRAEQRDYEKMIKNVEYNMIKRERRENEMSGPTLKNALLPLHMMLGLFAGFILGYVAGGALKYSESHKMIAGLVSMVLTFALEIFIFLFNACKAEVYSNDIKKKKRTIVLNQSKKTN